MDRSRPAYFPFDSDPDLWVLLELEHPLSVPCLQCRGRHRELKTQLNFPRKSSEMSGVAPLASAKGVWLRHRNGICQHIVGPWVERIMAMLGQSALGASSSSASRAMGRWWCTGMLVGE